MLTSSSLIPYLLERKLLTAQAVVEGDLAVSAVSRRNLTYKFVSNKGPSYVIKQGADQEKAGTVAHEAAVYRFLGGMPTAARSTAICLPFTVTTKANNPNPGAVARSGEPSQLLLL